MLNNLLQMHLKLLRKEWLKKKAELTGDLIGNETADKIKVSKTSSQNNSETNEEEILRKWFIPSELRHEIIDNLRLKKESYWWSKINIIIQYNNGISKKQWTH